VLIRFLIQRGVVKRAPASVCGRLFSRHIGAEYIILVNLLLGDPGLRPIILRHIYTASHHTDEGASDPEHADCRCMSQPSYHRTPLDHTLGYRLYGLSLLTHNRMTTMPRSVHH